MLDTAQLRRQFEPGDLPQLDDQKFQLAADAHASSVGAQRFGCVAEVERNLRRLGAEGEDELAGYQRA